MAEMIPDRLPKTASVGENRVFALLEKLPDNVIVYYEPIIANRYPDFVVILPTIGILIIEAKGWYPTQIERADTNFVRIVKGGRAEEQKHPLRQARDYMWGLFDLAKGHAQTANLLNTTGSFEGRLKLPFGHVAFLNNCSRSQLSDRDLSAIFPPERTVCRDEMDAFEHLSPVDLLARFKAFFDPWFPFDPLDEGQINALRSVIHPQIKISFSTAHSDLKVLDLRQERNAWSIGEGHRVIYGVAGSGKTVILIARAKLISEHPEKKCLILCYNKDLASYFAKVFETFPNVVCFNFHAWGSENNTKFRKDESEEDYGTRLLANLKNGVPDFGAFDAVFIDEAQDFAQSWFQCAKLALKAPDDGDLLIVGDGSQKVYRRRPFSWLSSGINAQGRTINKKFDLDRNYRNTREILQLAASFAGAREQSTHPSDSTQIVVPDTATCLRTGPPPTFVLSLTPEREYDTICRKVRDWLDNGARPNEIAILYRANTGQWINSLASRLAENVPVNWQKACENQYKMEGGIVLTTMHSSKGLQWKRVIIARIDTLPFRPSAAVDAEDQLKLERGLMYVAMTRAEDELFLTAASRTGFAVEIEDLIR